MDKSKSLDVLEIHLFMEPHTKWNGYFCVTWHICEPNLEDSIGVEMEYSRGCQLANN
ncbi:hypothetical protein PDE_07578 [Penicillium oxalicum 114-2]|uniref:Uncharacterized protein n=1 Tax=Penicillium oxalicum (strain 114-2 / CGMCC 5302) TaxID=933388 RepID=S8B1D2_PENO1|nr:hypothetical protein PDE_07578 [Penicillium oxalicum 114-2]